MSTDWRALCRGSRVELDGDGVLVRFESGRSHRVQVCEADDTYEFHTIVARSSAGYNARELSLWIWRLNRTAQLVSFRIDTRGRVVASGWVSKTGVTAAEFLTVLRRVAIESDRIEFLLTGKDKE